MSQHYSNTERRFAKELPVDRDPNVKIDYTRDDDREDMDIEVDELEEHLDNYKDIEVKDTVFGNSDVDINLEYGNTEYTLTLNEEAAHLDRKKEETSLDEEIWLWRDNNLEIVAETVKGRLEQENELDSEQQSEEPAGALAAD